MADELTIYRFSRSEVEKCDFSNFLGLYSLDKLPAGSQLEAMMNSIIFGIDGYDDDPHEIHSIPEVRRFYMAFHTAWPYWLYFCDLDSDALKVMVLCCLPSIAAVKVDGMPKMVVEYKPLEMLRFFSNDFGAMNLICDRAEFSERSIYDRSKAVFEYFGMPYDAEPPP